MLRFLMKYKTLGNSLFIKKEVLKTVLRKSYASTQLNQSMKSVILQNSQIIRQKPLLSKFALICGSVFAGSCLYNVLASSSPRDAALVANLRKAYGYLFGCFALTFYATIKFIPIAVRSNPYMFFGAMFVNFISCIGLQRVSSNQNPVLAHSFLAVTCLSVSAILSFIIPMTNPLFVRQAALLTSVLFGGLCAVGSTTPIGKFDDMRGILSIGALVVFAACIANIFAPLHVTAFETLIINLGIPVYSGITLFAANDLRRNAEIATVRGTTFDPLFNVAHLYMSAFNLFILFLRSQERKKR